MLKEINKINNIEIKYNKLNVSFEYSSKRLYSFLTVDYSIKPGDYVIVPSNYTQEGYAVVKVYSVEEDTKHTWHKKIISKVNLNGELAHKFTNTLYFKVGEVVLNKDTKPVIAIKNHKKRGLQEILTDMWFNYDDYKFVVLPNEEVYELANKPENNYFKMYSSIEVSNTEIYNFYVNIYKKHNLEVFDWDEVEFLEDYSQIKLPQQICFKLDSDIFIEESVIKQVSEYFEVSEFNHQEEFNFYTTSKELWDKYGDGFLDYLSETQLLQDCVIEYMKNIQDKKYKIYSANLNLLKKVSLPFEEFKQDGEFNHVLNYMYIKVASLEVIALLFEHNDDVESIPDDVCFIFKIND